MAHIIAHRSTQIGVGLTFVRYYQGKPNEPGKIEIGLQSGISLILIDSEFDYVTKEVANARNYNSPNRRTNSHPRSASPVG